MRKVAFNKLAKLTMRQWLDFGLAMHELALARRKLASVPIRKVLLAVEAGDFDVAYAPVEATDCIERVRFAIPVVARRLPWRADCLIQALAARRWLARSGVRSAICIGVRKDGEGNLEAHAWLAAGDEIITGGEIASFTPVADSELLLAHTRLRQSN